jgi:hypothetical protein
VNGTVSTSEWYTARVDGGSKKLALQIEADWGRLSDFVGEYGVSWHHRFLSYLSFPM